MVKCMFVFKITVLIGGVSMVFAGIMMCLYLDIVLGFTIISGGSFLIGFGMGMTEVTMRGVEEIDRLLARLRTTEVSTDFISELIHRCPARVREVYRW
jgi:hypothetical protein